MLCVKSYIYRFPFLKNCFSLFLHVYFVLRIRIYEYSVQEILFVNSLYIHLINLNKQFKPLSVDKIVMKYE